MHIYQALCAQTGLHVSNNEDAHGTVHKTLPKLRLTQYIHRPSFCLSP